VLNESFESAAWRQDEVDTLSSWVDLLPKTLVNSDEPINLYKDHSAFAQHQSQNLNINLQDYSPGELPRSFIHALLHVFAQRLNINSDEQWRSISGWGGRWAPLLVSADNQDERAYASASGMDSPEEDFVTVAEQFFLPSDGPVEDSVKCRIEKKYAYVAAKFPDYLSLFERAGINCQSIDHGFLNDLKFIDPVTGNVIDIGAVNQHTVSGFELLYATPGTSDAAEIAGHLLLRVKLDNNPDAERMGYENPNDLVISFLADTQPEQSNDVEGGEIPAICESGLFVKQDALAAGFLPMMRSVWQALKGLSGGFLTVMDRQTLGQTIKHYTLDEDRNLLRFELKLNSQQKQQLLDYLFQAKKNYKSEYYFFSNNCASVLVKIIANGIGANDIAEFNPWVSPPNALVALFLRHDLAHPVYPSFYSFRQQGQIAQDAARQFYQSLTRDYASRPWPQIEDVFQDDDQFRSAAIARLRKFSQHNPDIEQPLLRLSQLIHQADLTYSFRDQVCQQITPQSTGEIRRWQQQFAGKAYYQSDFAALQQANYQLIERESFAKGVAHTKLLNVSLAGSYRLGDVDNRSGVRIAAAFMQQDMGSMANIAMQRSSAVELGSLDAGLRVRDDGDVDVDNWRFTALSVRKFKQRLTRVPGFFSPDGKLGVGLNVLKIQSDRQSDRIHATLFGGEALFNAYSSADNDDHAFVSLGLELHRHIEQDEDRFGLMAPVYLETLTSWLPQRRLQWRNHWEVRYAKPQQLSVEWQVQSRLSYRLATKPAMALIFISAERWHWSDVAADNGFVSVGLEWNRF